MLDCCTRKSRCRGAFTLIEVLVVIAIVTILLAFLMPALVRARQEARECVCKNNLHQQGLAFSFYNNDWDGFYPPGHFWKTNLETYLSTHYAFKCPSRPDLPWHLGHGYNVGCVSARIDPARYSGGPVVGIANFRVHAVKGAATKIVTAEWDQCAAGPPIGQTGFYYADGTAPPPYGPGCAALCYWAVCRVHDNGSNVLFAEGHVEWMLPDQYHSDTLEADQTGSPVPVPPGTDITTVPESVWRKYWDPTYTVE